MTRMRFTGPFATLFVPVLCTAVLGLATTVAWTRTADSDAVPGVATVAVSGADLFRAKGCATCHDGPASTTSFHVGPNLENLPSVASSREPPLGAEDYVRRSISDPGGFIVPGYDLGERGAMPALPVTPAEVDELLEYLLP